MSQYLIELPDGYLIAGIKQIEDYTSKAFVLKTDLQGNQLWEKKYGITGVDSGIGSIQYIDSNTVVIGSAKGDIDSPYSINDDWWQGWIFGIDSLGNIKWEWESEMHEETLGSGLIITENDEYIYTTSELLIPNIFTVEIQRKVVKRDNNFNLLWSLDLSPFPAPEIRSFNITPTGDGHYAVVGNWNTIDSSNTMFTYGWVGGCIVKFTEDGEKLWSVCDTIANTSEYNYYNDSGSFRGITSLPSGSIIAAGGVKRNAISGQGLRSMGWLYKVTSDGCMDTLCNLSTALFPPKLVSEKIKVFPNPAYSELTIDMEGNFDLKLFDVLGREVRFVKDQRQSFVMSIGDLKEGVYFLQLLREDAIIDVRQIVIQR